MFSPVRMIALTNNFLLVSIIVLGGYIIATPYLPVITHTIQEQSVTEYDRYVYKSEAAVTKGLDQKKLKPIPTEDRIIIPSMSLDAPILEGDSKDVLDSGIWRRPKTSTPDAQSNTVIVAHRFLYTKNNSSDTFYFLDQVKIGDTITIFWKKKEYSYRVTTIKTVDPSAIEIEKPSDTPILTLYTCTPVWSAAQRLVVVAIPI